MQTLSKGNGDLQIFCSVPPGAALNLLYKEFGRAPSMNPGFVIPGQSMEGDAFLWRIHDPEQLPPHLGWRWGEIR